MVVVLFCAPLLFTSPRSVELFDVPLQMTRLFAGEVALFAGKRFLPRVRKHMILESIGVKAFTHSLHLSGDVLGNHHLHDNHQPRYLARVRDELGVRGDVADQADHVPIDLLHH